MSPTSAGLLRVFVYGTLKRGGEFHDRFCRGVLSVEEGSLRGHLSRLPAGYPIVEVNESEVLALGTADPLADVTTQQSIAFRRSPSPAPTVFAQDQVAGEILTFDDPEERLPALDRLEGFRPGRWSLYRRVLVPVTPGTGSDPVAAWVYVAP